MSPLPESSSDNIAPLLRLGLDEEPPIEDPNATFLVTAPAPRTGGSPSMNSRGWEPPSVEQLQNFLPQYEISAFIARGGMGAVYKGQQRTLKRPVAIKVLPPDLEDGDLQFAARFKHEAQAMAQLSHPNIVTVYDAGETLDGLLYFVMEFIEGTDLAQLIASEGQLDPLRAIQITTAVCEALAFAHEEGIIHRDIKPSNIMLDRKGRVKVADFGLAKTVNLDHSLQTQSNMTMGTPDFMAPEALMPGMKVDSRADLYAVGVMLYQMLTGHIPRGRFELPSCVVPQVNKGFDVVVDKAMQTDREKRYSTAFEMKTAVEKVGDGSAGAPARPGAGGGKAAKEKEAGKSVSAPVKSRTTLLIAAAVVVIGAGAFFAFKKPEAGKADGPPVATVGDSAPSGAKAASYPQPAQWTDATAGLRPQYLANGDLVAEGEWLKAAATKGFDLKSALQSRNPIVRVVFTDRVAILLRRNLNRQIINDDTFYLATIGHEGVTIVRRDRGEGSVALMKLTEKYAPNQLDGAHEAVFAAQGGTLTLWLDDQLVATAHDGALTSGGLALMLTKGDPNGDGGIKKVEYGELPDAAPPSTPAPIKLLDSQEKLPKQQGVAWEDNALRLDGAGLFLPNTLARDSLVRASVRMNPDAKSPILTLRRSPTRKNTEYQACIKASAGKIVMERVVDNIGQCISEWPLPRAYAATEWLKLEFRAVGDALTITADGVIIGTVKDATLSYTGTATIHAVANGYFRDIEYVPLDATSDSAKNAAIKLWDTPDKIPSKTGVRLEDGTLLLESTNVSYSKKLSRDAILRVEVRMNSSRAARQFGLRQQAVEEGGDNYRIEVFSEAGRGNFVMLEAVHVDKSIELGRWRLPRAYGPDDWLPVELRAVGSDLTVSAGGEVLGTVQDSSLTKAGGVFFFANEKGYFRNIVYVPLDGLSEAEALKAVGSAGVAEGATWQNLMPLIKPARHTINGKWEDKDGELICRASPWALCEIPVDYHGGSYDLRVTVTRGEGDRLALFFPFRKGDAAGDVVFDYFDNFSDGLKRAGLENLGGLKQSDPGSVFRMKSEWIPKGQKSTVLLQVRDEGIAVSLNGAEVYRWKADWTKIRQTGGFENSVFANLNGRPVFGVGLFNCDAIYHSIEMREVTGAKGKNLPPVTDKADRSHP